MTDEKFEVGFDITDKAIDDAIRKLTRYEQLVRRTNSSVLRNARASGISGGGRGAASNVSGLSGLGSILGTFAGAPAGEKFGNKAAIKGKELRTISLQRKRGAALSFASARLLGSDVGADVGAGIGSNIRTKSRPPVKSKVGGSGINFGSQAKSFADARATQVAEQIARGGFNPVNSAKQAAAGLSGRVGSVIGAGVGGTLGSIIPVVGTIAGAAIGAFIGEGIISGAEFLSATDGREKERRLVRERNLNGAIRSLSTKTLRSAEEREKFLREERIIRGSDRVVSSIMDAFAPGFLFGTDVSEVIDARQQKARNIFQGEAYIEAESRRSGGRSNDAEMRRVEQLFNRLVRR